MVTCMYLVGNYQGDSPAAGETKKQQTRIAHQRKKEAFFYMAVQKIL